MWEPKKNRRGKKMRGGGEGCKHMRRTGCRAKIKKVKKTPNTTLEKVRQMPGGKGKRKKKRCS